VISPWRQYVSKIKFCFQLARTTYIGIFSHVFRIILVFDHTMEDLLQQSSSALLKRRFNMDDISCEWTYPTDPAFGDLSTTIALTLSKKLKTSPQDIASVIVDSLSRDSAVSKVEMKGAEYINVWLTPAALLKGLSDTQDSLTPQGPKPSSPPVIVEYSQPNIAKPLGAHHLLSTLIGQAISNIYEHLGYTVVRWNYLGDWGTQFGKLAVAYEKWGDGRDASKYSVDELLDLYVRFHMEAESDRSLDDSAREAFLKLENGEATLQTFWEKVSETT
jgi:arginyl-tRNA synthetase